MILGRVVKPGEREWLQEDAEAVFAWIREQHLRCPGCGLPRDETMQHEGEVQYRSRAFQCQACAARDRESKRFTGGPHDDTGLYFTVERMV